jgi:hypothetical protein
MKSREIDTCMNCGAKLPHPPKIFQGVLICENCFKMVSHFVKRTQEELRMLFLVYTDLLRAALVKGELRPPPAVPGKEMPVQEFAKAFQQMAQRFGGINVDKKTRPGSQGTVPSLRLDDNHADGASRRG